MAKQNKTTLKGYFETGDVPNQNQYGELIDSQLNLAETGTQTSAGIISASGFISNDNLIVKGYISASGHISASAISASSNINIGGKITGLTGSFGHIMGNLADGTGSIFINDNTTFKQTITASSNISASGHISCSGLIIGGSEIRAFKGNITASGTITAVGGIIGPITSTGITSTGPGVFTTIDTGQGATEVHLMDQNVREADAVTFATVDTGQGANELYDMDQNVTTTATPTFAALNIGKVAKGGIGTYGGTIVVPSGGKAFTFTLTGISTIPGINSGQISKSAPTLIQNASVEATDAVLINCINQQLSVTAFGQSTAADAGTPGFYINLSNDSHLDFTAGTAQFTVVVL